MKYIVIELQTNKEGAVTHLFTEHNSKEEAESKFFSIMAHAAVSKVPVHSAIIVSEEGYPAMNKSYKH